MKFIPKFIIFLLSIITSIYANAQTCSGSLGNPIVNFNFGSGANPGPQVAATNYTFTSTDCPPDGSYTVRNKTSGCFNNSWHTINSDHTGNPNGYFMLINASVQPSTFYIDTVHGLCPNTTYEFGAWIMNVILPSACNSNSNQPNITFSIEKTDGTILQTNTTGNIPTTTTTIWNQKSFLFTTTTGVSDIVLRMVNNAPGGCGNDVAIDDITFRPCGPLLSPTIDNAGNQNTSIDFCKGEAKSYSFSCAVSAGYTNPIYQWQQSFNNSIFTDIVAANSTTLQVQFSSNAAVGVYSYRLKAVEATNVSSPQCSVFSSPLTITIKELPQAMLTSNSPVCQNNNLQLAVIGGLSYNWQGPNNFSSNSSTPVITNAQVLNQGKYYVSVAAANLCTVLDSINVLVNSNPVATVLFADSTICGSENILLSAGGGIEYSWEPLQYLTTPTQQNTFSKPIESIRYKVIVKNTFNCIDTAFVNITVIKKPVVNAGLDQTIIAGKTIMLAGSIIGDVSMLQWSPNQYINDVSILNPLVNPPRDFQYILTVTAPNNCGVVTDSIQIKIFNGIYIPNAFSPNGDGKNDAWNVPALEAFPLHTLAIYNRYGELVFERQKSFLPWNGIFKGQLLPPGVYTYVIDLKNGTVSLRGTILLIK